MIVDLIYLTHNRREFTKVSLDNLLKQTDLSQFRKVLFYDDDSSDGTTYLVAKCAWELNGSPDPEICDRITAGGFRNVALHHELHSPVAVMREYLDRYAKGATHFIKLDNDVMVPPGWYDTLKELALANPSIDFIGLEARDGLLMDPSRNADRQLAEAKFIGGIGLMRIGAFTTLPIVGRGGADGRFGFTDWQDKNPQVKKAWIVPAMPVFLLNRLPFEPWASLSREYVANGWERAWPGPYNQNEHAKWDWYFGQRDLSVPSGRHDLTGTDPEHSPGCSGSLQ